MTLYDVVIVIIVLLIACDACALLYSVYFAIKCPVPCVLLCIVVSTVSVLE